MTDRGIATRESANHFSFSYDETALYLPIRIGPDSVGTWGPSLRIGDEILTIENANWASGCWQLIVWSTAAEAKAAATALRLIDRSIQFQTTILPTGEAMLLTPVWSGETEALNFQVSDRRLVKGPMIGSWSVTYPQAVALRAREMPDPVKRIKVLKMFCREESDGLDKGSALIRSLLDETDFCDIGTICATRIRSKIASICGTDVAEAIPDSAIKSRVARIRNQISGTIDVLTDEVAFDVMASDAF